MHTLPRTNPASMHWPLLAIAGLIATTIAVTAGVRLSGMSISQPDAPVLMARTLLFTDRTDGGIDVFDAQTHQRVETVVGQAGFVRGTLRGLARDRRRAGFGPSLPFDLIAHTDGRLTLVDPTTSRRIDLESFGPTNMASFAQLFAGEPRPASPGN